MVMIDVVVPAGNEERLLRMAENLGFTSLCFVYGKPDKVKSNKVKEMAEKTKLKIHIGSINPNSYADIVFGDVSKKDIMDVIQDKKIDIIFGFEDIKGRDRFNQRSSGLDPVLCKLASQRKKIYCVDFGRILVLDKRKRTVAFGRLKQNIMLCRKYKIEIAIASFATTPLKMRNPSDMSGILAVLGHDSGKRPLEVIEERIILNQKKRSGKIISEGIEVV